MNIAIPNGTSGFLLLSNKDLKVGDQVFPLTQGYNDGKNYFVINIVTNPALTGWPNNPHTILDLAHSESKPYEIRTDKGFGPRESYFKKIPNT